jgi:hypothetical protein
MPTSIQSLIGYALIFGFWACAGAPASPALEPVAAPRSAGATKPEGRPTPVPPVEDPDRASSDAPPPAAPSAAAETPVAVANSTAESNSPSRSAVDILTSADTAFLIAYSSSAPVEAAHRTCTEKSAVEPEAQAKCLSDAREAFKADVIRFRKGGAHGSWTVYKRKGSRLDEVTSGSVDFSEDSPNRVKIKFLGDKGIRPLLRNKREAVITVPNDYSFEIDDAEWGKLIYEAKIGLVGN